VALGIAEDGIPGAVLLVFRAELQPRKQIRLAARVAPRDSLPGNADEACEVDHRGIAAAFLVGRVLHGYAFAATAGNTTLRVRGMQLTLFSIVLLALLNIAALILGLVG